MKNQQIIQRVCKVLYILSKIAYVACIVCACICAVGVASIAACGNNPEVLQRVLDLNMEYDFNTWLCYCICGLVECGFGIALYYMVQNFYKFELACGDPFKAEVADKMKTLGLVHLILPLANSIAVGIIAAAFQVTFGYGSMFGITMGFVYLVVCVLIRHHLDLENKHAVELVKGDMNTTDTDKKNNV